MAVSVATWLRYDEETVCPILIDSEYYCQLRLLLLKCVLFNFIVMYPSDLRPRLYMPPMLQKTREDALTGQCGGRDE